MAKTLLVPLDGSMLAESTLPYTAAALARGGAKIVVVRVAAAHGGPGSNAADQQLAAIEEAAGYLQKQADRLSANGLVADAAVPYGDAAAPSLGRTKR